MGFLGVNWSLQAKNLAVGMRAAVNLVELKMRPEKMAKAALLAPYALYKHSTDENFNAGEVLLTHAAAQVGFEALAVECVENLHAEPVNEQQRFYHDYVDGLGGYSQCVAVYAPYIDKSNAYTLCQHMMGANGASLTTSELELIAEIEKGYVHTMAEDADISVRAAVTEAIPDISFPDTSGWGKKIKDAIIPDVSGVTKAALTIIGIIILGVVVLVALGYSGLGGAAGKAAEKRV